MLHTTVGVEWFMICSIPKNELIANNQFCRDGIASINWSSTGVYMCAWMYLCLDGPCVALFKGWNIREKAWLDYIL